MIQDYAATTLEHGRFRHAHKQDLFAEAREKLAIADAWQMLGLSGEPKASCRSPFREDRSPSFSIYLDGRAWTDHGSGEGGDVVEFIKTAIGGDYREVRRWLQDRIGVEPPAIGRRMAAKPSQDQKRIDWPAELAEGDKATWDAFAKKRGFSYPAVHVMVHAGILRFCRLPDGTTCFIVTDDERRAAELRRIDGKLFGASKAFPLRGVDKAWLPGAELLKDSPKDVGVIVTEGATDLLAAFALYADYRRDGGAFQWSPVAVLGAGCKRLAPDCAELIRGRHVRLIPDADAAGDSMADHWQTVFRRIGCTVDVVELERNTDLSANITTINKTQLFAR